MGSGKGPGTNGGPMMHGFGGRRRPEAGSAGSLAVEGWWPGSKSILVGGRARSPFRSNSGIEPPIMLMMSCARAREGPPPAHIGETSPR